MNLGSALIPPPRSMMSGARMTCIFMQCFAMFRYQSSSTPMTASSPSASHSYIISPDTSSSLMPLTAATSLLSELTDACIVQVTLSGSFTCFFVFLRFASSGTSLSILSLFTSSNRYDISPATIPLPWSIFLSMTIPPPTPVPNTNTTALL